MPKKKTAKRDEGKARLEIRFDADVYAKVKEIADTAQISVNQLLHGLARWATANVVIGEPYHDEEGRIRNREQAGCVWFGRPARFIEGGVSVNDDGDVSEDDGRWDKGEVKLSLDFTERRVVRKDV